MAAYSLFGPLRARVRRRFFRVLEQAFATDDGRRLLADTLRGIGDGAAARARLSPYATHQPYPDLGHPNIAGTPPTPVFITARFRSGSTLLWNLFRHVPECTAYYEPLNERRWFDPASRGDRVDGTHSGVSDYWREYDGLAHIGRWYQPHWIDRRLYMDASSWDPHLFAYISALVAAAPHRAVLQFNRVDFRLPWLRHYFPHAVLIHLYRHPRDQWCSTLIDVKSFPLTGTVAEFERHDHFYLLPWVRDLAHQFPFLDVRAPRHPYQVFYLIWKLSWLFGIRDAHASFCYEALCQQDDELDRLMRSAHITAYDCDALRRLIGPAPAARWAEYASADWFEDQEARAEEMLALAFGPIGLADFRLLTSEGGTARPTARPEISGRAADAAPCLEAGPARPAHNVVPA